MRNLLLGAMAVSLLSGLSSVGTAAPPDNVPARTPERTRPDRGGRPETAAPPTTRPTPTQAVSPSSRPELPGRPELPTDTTASSARQRAQQVRQQIRDARVPDRALPTASTTSAPGTPQAQRMQVDRRNMAAQSRERRPGGVVDFLFERFGRERRAVGELNSNRRDHIGSRELPSRSARGTGLPEQELSEQRAVDRRSPNPPLPRADRQLAQRLAQIDRMRDRAIETGNDQLLTVADQLEAVARRQYSRRTVGLEPPTEAPTSSGRDSRDLPLVELPAISADAPPPLPIDELPSERTTVTERAEAGVNADE